MVSPFGNNSILWATPSAAGPRSVLAASGLQFLGIVGSGPWHSWYANLSFSMIGGFTLACLGTLGRFWDTWEHNKGHFEFQAWIFTDFLWILVPMGVIWHAWCLHFGVLGDSGTILGRSWDGLGTLEGTRKDLVRSRLGFYRFFVDLGDPF